MKCIEDEIPFELPQGWECERLSNIASFSGGKTPSTSIAEYWGNDYLWITSKDMKRKYIDSSQISLSKKGAEVMQIKAPNTLLMVTRSGILRHTLPVAILKEQATINQDIKAISLYDTSLVEFIYSFLKGIESYILLKYSKSGTTVENINFDEFKNIIIPVPPESEQIQIIEKINTLLSFIGIIESDKADLQTTIQLTKSKILDLAIRGKLVPQDPNDEPASVLLELIRAEKEELIKQGKIKRDKKESVIFKGEDNSYYQDLPQNWIVSTLREVTTPLTLNDGDWILSENMTDNGEVKLLQLGSIGNMSYIDKGFKYLTKDTFDELSCTEIFTEYLIINRIISDKMCCCIVPDIDGTIITTVDTCWIAPSETLYDIKFLMYQLASPSFQSAVLLKATGTTRKRISKNNLIDLHLLLPPLAEQTRIVKAIETVFSQLDEIADSIT